MKKWEYKVFGWHDLRRERFLDKGLEKYLNSLGQQGWELVDIEFRGENHTFFTGVAKREKDM